MSVKILPTGLGNFLRVLRAPRSPVGKVFVVGKNKTGTTSLAAALAILGYRLGDQARGELFIEDWAKRDFRKLVNYCRAADAFQDSPFSRDFTFQAMDAAFPGSKFVLTVRDSPEQWYSSLCRFHTMRLRERTGQNRLPASADLMQDPYLYRGYLWRVEQLVRGLGPNDDPYDKSRLISEYEDHNKRVQDYFRHRPCDLLVLNVADPAGMEKLCRFLGRRFTGQQMPRLNESR